MNEDEFLAHVRERASLASSDRARIATEATLRVLGARLSESEAKGLAARLPESFGAVLVRERGAGAETFGAETFVERVGEREAGREHVDADDAERHARAVATTLNDLVLDEHVGVRDGLSEGYDRLFDPADFGT